MNTATVDAEEAAAPVIETARSRTSAPRPHPEEAPAW